MSKKWNHTKSEYRMHPGFFDLHFFEGVQSWF